MPYSYAQETKLKVTPVPIYYPSYYSPSEDEPEVADEFEYDDSEYGNQLLMTHEPVLVEYGGYKSLVTFVKHNNQSKYSFIYNLNLANNKMNAVGMMIPEDEIISVFGYEFNEEHLYLLVLTKHTYSSEKTIYSTARYSIYKEEGGLYIQQFKVDSIMIPELSVCIDGIS